MYRGATVDLKTHLTTGKALGIAVVLILLIAGISRGCGSDDMTYSAAVQAKIDALNDARKNGLVDEHEYEEKLRDIKAEAAAEGGGGVDDPAHPAATLRTSNRTKTAEIQDPAWGITAYHIEIPSDWKFEGTVLRNDECGFPESFTWRLSSADGLYGAQYLPEFESHASNSDVYLASYSKNHCKVMEPMDAEALLNYIVPFTRPNPTIGEIVPTVDAETYQENANKDSQRIYGNSGQISATAVHSVVQYAFHGQPMEEDISVHMKTTKRRVPPYVGPTAFFEWVSNGVIVGVRAPKGHLEEATKVIRAIVSTGAITDEWRRRSFQKIHDDQQRIMQWSVGQREATFRSIEASHAAFMQKQQEQFERHSDQIEEQMEAMHRSAQAYVLYASDEQLFRNPDTGEEIRAPIQYGNNAWQDPISKGILLSDNPNINPSLFERAKWSQLERVNPMRPDQ